MTKPANAKRHATQQSLNGAIKAICDIMRRSNCAGAMQYVPELTWILFLRIFDEREQQEAEFAQAVAAEFTPSFPPPYRWRDWAAPEGGKRKELQAGTLGAYLSFVNGELIPFLRGLESQPNATPRQKVISEIMSGVERVRIDTERNLLDVLDRVQNISAESVDDTHIFTLSQVYEGLLLKMGEKGKDGGQFFTPREVIRAMVKTIHPKIGETIYDPGCGTGGFLAQAYEYVRDQLGEGITPGVIEAMIEVQRDVHSKNKMRMQAHFADKWGGSLADAAKRGTGVGCALILLLGLLLLATAACGAVHTIWPEENTVAGLEAEWKVLVERDTAKRRDFFHRLCAAFNAGTELSPERDAWAEGILNPDFSGVVNGRLVVRAECA